MSAAALSRPDASGGWLARLDARVKLLGVLALILALVSAPAGAYWLFSAYLLLLTAAAVISRAPGAYYLARLALALPFILLAALGLPFVHDAPGGGQLGVLGLSISLAGLKLLLGVTAKALLAVLALSLLSATTSFPVLLESLARLTVPPLLVQLAGFTHRYLAVLGQEALRLRRAAVMRGWRPRWLWQARLVGQLVGVLFLRSLERAERIHLAMLSRGFTGALPPSAAVPLTRRDWLAGLGALAVVALLRVLA